MASCRRLLGLDYALLRDEFVCQHEVVADPDAAGITAGDDEVVHSAQPVRILVTLGGSDPDNVTATIMQALEHVDASRLEVRVVVGPANQYVDEIQRTADASRHPTSVLVNVDDMPAQYRWADAVIGAAGSSCWEWLIQRTRGRHHRDR